MSAAVCFSPVGLSDSGVDRYRDIRKNVRLKKEEEEGAGEDDEEQEEAEGDAEGVGSSFGTASSFGVGPSPGRPQRLVPSSVRSSISSSRSAARVSVAALARGL